VGRPDGEEIMTLTFFVLTQYRLVTDGGTDGQTRCCRKDPRAPLDHIWAMVWSGARGNITI